MSETSKNAVNDKKKAKLEKKQMKAAKKDARKKESNVKVKTKKVKNGKKKSKVGVVNRMGFKITLALAAAVISIVVKEIMYWYTRNAAKKINSGALMADAWHHRSAKID